MRARVAKYPPRTTFHTASEGEFCELRLSHVLDERIGDRGPSVYHAPGSSYQGRSRWRFASCWCLRSWLPSTGVGRPAPPPIIRRRRAQTKPLDSRRRSQRVHLQTTTVLLGGDRPIKDRHLPTPRLRWLRSVVGPTLSSSSPTTWTRRVPKR